MLWNIDGKFWIQHWSIINKTNWFNDIVCVCVSEGGSSTTLAGGSLSDFVFSNIIKPSWKRGTRLITEHPTWGLSYTICTHTVHMFQILRKAIPHTPNQENNLQMIMINPDLTFQIFRFAPDRLYLWTEKTERCTVWAKQSHVYCIKTNYDHCRMFLQLVYE